MRIVFLVDMFPCISETFILNQITGLIDLGHEVRIFAAARPSAESVPEEIEKYDLLDKTFYHNDRPGNWLRRICGAFVLFWPAVVKDPIPVLRSLNFFRYGKEALSLNLFYKVILFLKEGPFDIMQCHFGPNGNLGALMKRLGIRAKVVTMFHGYDTRRGALEGKDIYSELFRSGDCFLSISDYNYKNLIAFGADPSKIVYHPVGIDLERFKYEEKSKPADSDVLRIISVARLVEEKGLAGGIKAFKELLCIVPEGIDLEYVIAGGGPLKTKLQMLADDAGISDKVKFEGEMTHQEIEKAFSRSHVFFLPSISEALPVALMEAQACGLPAVASDVGSVAQVLYDGESGFLAIEGDARDMASKLKRLIDDPGLCKSMGVSGRKIVDENYNIAKLNPELVQIYKGLIKGDI